MTDRKNAVRGRDDKDLHDAGPTPSQGGRGGGGIGRDVGTRDEEKAALGGDPQPTGVHKGDHVQPATRTRSDHHQAKR
jgi:hypothetical protein